MLEKLLRKYPEGSDITVMNMHYRYPHRDEDGNLKPDTMNIIIKDNTTGKKDHVLIKNPKYRFYVINNKELYTNKNGEEYPLLFTEESNVTPVEVPYKKISKAIAEVVGKEGAYYDALEAGDKKTLRNFHMESSIMNSDQDIEDHYRVEFARLYTNNIKKITKAYFDIEVDIKGISGDFVKPGEAPVNAISFLNESTNRVYTFLLRQKDNPLIEQMENLYKSGVINQKYIHDFIEKSVGGHKKMHQLGLENLDYKLIWFDDEIQLIYTFFKVLHQCDPDFFMGWNSSGFDMPYLIARVQALGFKPEDILCDESWEDDNKFVKHYVDEKNFNDFAERGDYTFISGNSVHVDQMIQYCSRRKAKMGSMGSTKLDTIAELVAGIHKLDYSHITTDIGKLPYLDYITFVLYNIMDVICQKGIEVKCNDLEYIFSKCILNNTSYRKGHRQTVYLINRFTREWEKLGYIIGNNTNKNNEKPEKFAGALVGKWYNTSNYSKIHVNGRPIMVCDNLVDFDQYLNSLDTEFEVAQARNGLVKTLLTAGTL